MNDIEVNLNGLDNETLPPILPNTANEIIHVNSNETNYELIPFDNLLPNPITNKQILNSTAGNIYGWTDNPKATSITTDGGASNGFKFDGTTSSIITEFYTVKILNQGTSRVECSTSGVDLKGAVSVDNQIICVNNGIGTTSTNRVEFGATNISLRANNTIRVQATGTGVTLVGSISQLVGTNTNQFNGNHTFQNGTMTIDGNTTFLGSSNVTATNGNITSTNGQVNGYSLKSSNAGTGALCAVRVVDDNNGLYQSASGNLDIVGGGTTGLNVTSSRVQTQNIFNFNRGPAFVSGIYNIAQTNNIVTTTQPLIIAQTPTSGNLDLEFTTATNYFSGQQFQIIVRNVGAGTCRYRAQSTTYHVTGGAAIVTIASNTFHTLVNDRFHILICNVDSNSFYLIQT